MTIGIDMGAMSNEILNDMLLKDTKDERVKALQDLTRFANKHGYWGGEAVVFVTEMLEVVGKVDEKLYKLDHPEEGDKNNE